nr:glycogen debranching enzyme [Nocardioidaceae bacterium]
MHDLSSAGSSGAGLRCRPGDPHHLGATFAASGTNFAVWAPAASRVALCLFDGEQETQLHLHGPKHGVWHGRVAGIEPGQRYGFRVEGSWRPAQGQLPNPDKLLLDPYCRAFSGEVTPHDSLATLTDEGERNGGDTAPYMPRSV